MRSLTVGGIYHREITPHFQKIDETHGMMKGVIVIPHGLT